MEVRTEAPEIQVWIMGLASARDELDADEFKHTVGMDGDEARALRRRLVAARDVSRTAPTTLSLTGREVAAISSALDVAMHGLGEVEFETVVGQTWDFGKRTLLRLQGLTESTAGDG